MEERASPDRSSLWNVCNARLPKAQITYFTQIVIIYIIIITCLVNLSLNIGDSTLFQTLLASCVGYILPAPRVKSPKYTTTSSPV